MSILFIGNIIARGVVLIREDAGFHVGSVGVGGASLVRRRIPRLKREVQEVANEMQRTAAQQSERRRRSLR